MTALSPGDEVFCTELAAEFVDEAQLLALGAKQLRPIIGDAKVTRRNEQELARDRLSTIAWRVATT